MSEELIALEGSPDDLLLVEDQWGYDKDAPDHRGAYLGKQAVYWCENCGNPHHVGVTVNGVPYKQGHSWGWNGRVDQGVVLSPSQLIRSYRYPHDGSEQDKADFDKIEKSFDALVASRFRHVCHTFIGMGGAPPGHIIHLNDSFLRGKPAPLNGQVRPLLARKNWPGAHGRLWAKLYVKG
jgi:hypothetical protein